MPTCPYVVLGVRRNATQVTIRRAYRKAAMKHHPDRNPGDEGAQARFQEVQNAFDLLSDPERRKRYDATGETDVPKSQDVAELISCLSQFLASAVQASQFNGPKRTDMAAKMKSLMDQEISATDQSLADMRKAHIEQTDIMARFTVDGGENFLAGIVRQGIVHIEAQIAALENKGRVMRAAYDYLKGCQYRVDGSGSSTPKDGLVKSLNAVYGRLTWGTS